nr:Chain I, HIV-1 Env Fusion Peptide [Human immunodeficiency virus 1]8F7Z_K Chain K, HIV-1 Env Fusion Peptide [Human immunodeficiency virus 1]8F7Z_L Chain L, HIV-1 Env Fusion Peptide [Human immunodeficiency virus 1]8F7Z_M Chain M, HIV-1 Env Fusion Peptide [Human immunodeficiency virus 1]
AVGTIGAM